jgi:hypothetical protein
MTGNNTRFDGNVGAEPNYEPNSFGGPTQDPTYREHARTIAGWLDRHNHRDENDSARKPLPLDASGRQAAADQQHRRQYEGHSAAHSGTPDPALLQGGPRLRNWGSQGPGLNIETIVRSIDNMVMAGFTNRTGRLVVLQSNLFLGAVGSGKARVRRRELVGDQKYFVI